MVTRAFFTILSKDVIREVCATCLWLLGDSGALLFGAGVIIEPAGAGVTVKIKQKIYASSIFSVNEPCHQGLDFFLCLCLDLTPVNMHNVKLEKSDILKSR